MQFVARLHRTLSFSPRGGRLDIEEDAVPAESATSKSSATSASSKAADVPATTPSSAGHEGVVAGTSEEEFEVRKQEANKLFATGQLEQALGSYAEAIAFGEERKLEATKIAVLWTNRAVTQYKLGR